MGWKTWTTLILVALSAFFGALFYLQNSLRKVDLSLDLYVAAWRLQEPVSVPLVVFVSFGVGLRLARTGGGPSGSAGAGGPIGGPSADLWT